MPTNIGENAGKSARDSDRCCQFLLFVNNETACSDHQCRRIFLFRSDPTVLDCMLISVGARRRFLSVALYSSWRRVKSDGVRLLIHPRKRWQSGCSGPDRIGMAISPVLRESSKAYVQDKWRFQ